MVSQTIQESLNKQVLMEAESSQAYLAMASWAEIQPGLQGVTDFFYQQSDEERVARTLNDKLELIGDDKSSLYLFDRDIMNYRGPKK
jgi:ferritin